MSYVWPNIILRTAWHRDGSLSVQWQDISLTIRTETDNPEEVLEIIGNNFQVILTDEIEVETDEQAAERRANSDLAPRAYRQLRATYNGEIRLEMQMSQTSIIRSPGEKVTIPDPAGGAIPDRVKYAGEVQDFAILLSEPSRLEE